MTELHPIKFQPIFKDKIWGGERIKTVLQKDYNPLPNCGETWEVSGVEGDISVVSNGALAGRPLTELVARYKDALVGKKVYQQHGDDFPLLIKFIDANDDLSIQVHPGDELAATRHQSFGKTEMWYVLYAEPNAFLYNGFRTQIDQDEYQQRIQNKTILEVLNKEAVAAGDVFYIPAGRVHSIGKGIMIAEIQQTSDITYRIYDFDRRDNLGQGRQLHTEESKAAIDFTLHDEYKSNYHTLVNKLVDVVDSPYFKTGIIEVLGEAKINLEPRDSFTIVMCVQGEASLRINDFTESLSIGEVVLIPASFGEYKLHSGKLSRVVETFIP